MTKVVVITAADSELLEEYFQLCCYAFDRSDNTGRRDKFLTLAGHSHVFVLLDEQGQVKSGLMVTNFPVNWQGQEFLMGGVGYVATYPEFGGQGAISQLMHAAYELMAQEGVVFSYLAPFSFTFYRRFGYEQVFDQLAYELKAQDFPRLPKATMGKVERGDYLGDWELMNQLYSQSNQSQHGGVQRSEWWYRYLASKNDHFELAISYDDANQPDGYLLYERIPGVEFQVRELMANTVASRQRLLQFIGKHAGAYEKFTYSSGNQQPLNDLMPEAYRVKTTIQPYMMASVLDWVTLLTHWQYQVSTVAPFTIAIEDDFYPANAGVWEFQIKAGQGELISVETEQIDVHVDTRDLTKLVLGYRNVADLIATGQLKVSNSAVIAKLSACFNTQSKPMLWDYF